jgi:hypothetical protein
MSEELAGMAGDAGDTDTGSLELEVNTLRAEARKQATNLSQA